MAASTESHLLRDVKPNRPHPDGTTKVAPTTNGDECQGSYEFGPFQLESRTYLLFCEGNIVHLTPKVLEVLFALVEADGQLIEKDQLIKTVWPDCFVFVVMNRFEASLAESRRALDLEPLDLPISAHIGWHYFFARQYDRAVRSFGSQLNSNPIGIGRGGFFAWLTNRKTNWAVRLQY